MTQEEHGSTQLQTGKQNALVVKLLQMSGFGFFLAGVLLAVLAATVGLGSVELPFSAPWLGVGLIAVGAFDFAAAKVLAQQSGG